MDISFLESFVYIAETGSFTKAAAKLGYSQSSLSFQIGQLEEAIGAPLFDRVNHRISLTQVGRDALPVAQGILSEQKKLSGLAGGNGSPRGLVRIAMANSLCRLLFNADYVDFRHRYPALSLKIVEAGTGEMFRMLKENEADVVYTLDKHLYDSRHTIAFEHPVATHFVAPVGMLEKTSVDIGDLVHFPFILTEKDMSYRKLLDEQLAARSLEISPFMEIGDTSLICSMVTRGLGLSFLPDYVTDAYVSDGSIMRLDTGDFSVGTWTQIIYRKDKYISPHIRCVIDYLAETTTEIFSRGLAPLPPDNARKT